MAYTVNIKLDIPEEVEHMFLESYETYKKVNDIEIDLDKFSLECFIVGMACINQLAKYIL